MSIDFEKCSICNGKHLSIQFLCTNNECSQRRLMCRVCKKNSHDTHNTIAIDNSWNDRNAALNKFQKYYSAIDRNWDEMNSKFKNHTKTWKQILGVQVQEIELDTKQKNVFKMSSQELEIYVQAINNNLVQPYKKKNALIQSIQRVVKLLKQSIDVICTQVQDSFFDLYSQVEAISLRNIYEQQLNKMPQQQNKNFSSLLSRNSDISNTDHFDNLRKIVLKNDSKSISQILNKISKFHNLEEVVFQSQKMAKIQFIEEILKRVSNLKYLVFNCHNEFNDVWLSKLLELKPNLRRLYCCYNFQQSLSQFDQELSFKTTQNVYRYNGLSQNMTKSLMRNFHSLENIWFGNQVSKQQFDLTDDLSKIKDITLGHLMIKNRNPNKLLMVKLGYLRHLEAITFISLNINEDICAPIWSANHNISTICFLHCQGITDTTFKHIINSLHNLKNLAVYDNYQIQGIPLWNLTNLTILILSNCPKINRQASQNISKLQKLEHLNLNSNSQWIDCSSIEKISQIKSLRILNLSWCNLNNQDIQSLSNLKKLEVLFLGGNKIDGSKIAKLVSNFKCLSKLSLIGLHGNDGRGLLADKDLIQILERVQLSHLDISYCQQITTEVVSHLLGLQVIRLHGTKIKEEGIKKLKSKKIKIIEFI